MGQRRDLTGLRVLITGASRGLGSSLALAAARRGCRLVLAARSTGPLEQVAHEAEQLGAQVAAVAADVTRAEDRQRMLDTAVQRFGGLDILINNAGVGATGHFSDASEQRLRAIMEVNFFGTTEVTRLAIPLLAQGRTPMIVNVSSVSGKRATPARSEYCASKFAVQGLTESLRAELVRYGIDVLAVCPGLMATDFQKHHLEDKARMPMDHLRLMAPEQAAELIVRAIAKGKSEVVLTWRAKALLLVNRLFPRLIDYFAGRVVRRLYRDEIEQRAQAKLLAAKPG